MGKRVTVAEIKQRLIDNNRPITLLGYAGTMSNMTSRWGCDDCGHVWSTMVNVILKGHGCKPCGVIKSNNSKIVPEQDIKQRLIDNNRPITLLGYAGKMNDSSSSWGCDDCGHAWSTSASSVVGGSGCKPCGIIKYNDAQRMSKEEVEQRLIADNRPITVLNYGKNFADKSSSWGCDDCGHVWTNTAGNILNAGNRCPLCNGKIPLTLEIVVDRLIADNRTITVLNYGKNIDDNTSRWGCDDCGHVWSTSADKILNSGQGCAHCADYGFNPGKPAFVYLHTYNGFIKPGIARDLDQRHGRLNNQTIDGVTYTIESTISWYFEDGAEAQDLESTILDMFKKQSYTKLLDTSFDGKTELLESSAHDEIVAYVEENYDIS